MFFHFEIILSSSFRKLFSSSLYWITFIKYCCLISTLQSMSRTCEYHFKHEYVILKIFYLIMNHDLCLVCLIIVLFYQLYRYIWTRVFPFLELRLLVLKNILTSIFPQFSINSFISLFCPHRK